MTTAIIPVSDLKAKLRATGSNFDAALRSHILLASRQIETYCRREFVKQERIELFNTRQTYTTGYDFAGNAEDGLVTNVGEAEISLKARPVDTLATFEAHYDRLRRWTDETLIPTGNVFVDAQRGVAFIRHPMDYGSSTLRIRYTAGYPAVTVGGETYLDPDETPEDLKSACLAQAMFLWTKLSSENVGVAVDRGDSKERPVKFGALHITTEAQAALVDYRRILVGNG